MPRRDPYSDPYDRKPRRFAEGGSTEDDDTQVSVNVPPTGGPLPGALEAASAFSQKHQTRIDAREQEIRKTMEAQQLNVDQMTKILDEAAGSIKRNREGRTSLPLLKMGAAMMTTPGNFGTSLGAGFGAMAEGIAATRKEENEEDFKLLDLQMKKTTLANAPLEQRLNYIKALQTGDIAAQRAIESAIIKAQLTGKTGDTTDAKNFNLWRQSPGNENKSYDDWLKYKNSLKATDTEDAKNYELWKKKPGNENKTFEDWFAFKQGMQARSPADIQYQTQMNKERAEQNAKAGLKEGDPGFKPPLSLDEANAQRKAAETTAATTARETAEAQVKAKTSLGRTEQSINKATESVDQVLNDRNLDQFVGRAQGHITSKTPGISQDRQNFYNNHSYLVNQLFTQAIQPLIGTGAGSLSDAEGRALAQGFANLALTSDPVLYRKGLNDLKKQLHLTLEDVRRRASGQPTETPPARPPTEGNPTPPGQTGQSGAKPGGKPWERYGGGGG